MTENDAYRYRPMRPGHDPMWCREGLAVENARGALVDTYWHLHDTGPDAHVLTAEERRSAGFLANLDDYEELDRYKSPLYGGFEDYDPEDRLQLTAQHGHHVYRFIRKGAQPSTDAKVAWAQAQVHEAFEERDRGLRSIERARQNLHYARTGRWPWEEDHD